MNASNVDTWWGNVLGPVYVAGERYGGHVHICTGWGRPVGLVDDRIGEFERRVHSQDCTDVLKVEGKI